jgi:predicted DsbA family dithiol-disulfide isomerase
LISALARVVDIEIWSDVVCPWCYIGKRRLEEALRDYDGEANVTFRPFQLDPSPVPAPRPLNEALAVKFGGPARVEQMHAQVAEIGASLGLTLNFDRALAANTFDAHRLIAWADAQGRQLDLVEALQKAYFTEGADIGSHETLATIAGGIGLDEAAARAYLDGTDGVDVLRKDLAEARELGVTSVPTFVIAGKYAITGAQEAETLRGAFAEIAKLDAGAADR